MCWSLWKARNASYFDKKQLSNPINVVFSVCHWMLAWAGLQKRGDKDKLKQMAHVLSTVAHEVYQARYGWRPTVKRIASWRSGWDMKTFFNNFSALWLIHVIGLASLLWHYPVFLLSVETSMSQTLVVSLMKPGAMLLLLYKKKKIWQPPKQMPKFWTWAIGREDLGTTKHPHNIIITVWHNYMCTTNFYFFIYNWTIALLVCYAELEQCTSSKRSQLGLVWKQSIAATMPDQLVDQMVSRGKPPNQYSYLALH